MRSPVGRILRATAFTNNIVLVKAVGLCPIIAGGVNLKYGVALTACTLAVLLPSCLFIAGIGNRIPKWLIPPAYTLMATLLMVGASAVMQQLIDVELYASLMLYLPWMVVSTIFSYHGGFSSGTRPLLAAADAVGSSLGFGLVICVVSALREMMAYGTLWDRPVNWQWKFTSASLPFVAFILLAFAAAIWQAAKKWYASHHSDEEVEE